MCHPCLGRLNIYSIRTQQWAWGAGRRVWEGWRWMESPRFPVLLLCCTLRRERKKKKKESLPRSRGKLDVAVVLIKAGWKAAGCDCVIWWLTNACCSLWQQMHCVVLRKQPRGSFQYLSFKAISVSRLMSRRMKIAIYRLPMFIPTAIHRPDPSPRPPPPPQWN